MHPSHQGHREHSLLHQPADGFQESAAGARAQSAATEPQAAATDPPEPGDPAQREWRAAERSAGVQVAVPEPPLELPHGSGAPPLRQDRQPRWVPRKATFPGLGEKRGQLQGMGGRMQGRCLRCPRVPRSTSGWPDALRSRSGVRLRLQVLSSHAF